MNRGVMVLQGRNRVPYLMQVTTLHKKARSYYVSEVVTVHLLIRSFTTYKAPTLCQVLWPCGKEAGSTLPSPLMEQTFQMGRQLMDSSDSDR